jgi:hypothetical protein
MRRTLATIVGISLALGAASLRAATAPEMLCVQEKKVDLTACVSELTALRAQCNATYVAAVPPCFGTNAPCASTCLTDKETCDNAPEGKRDACNAACEQHATAVQADCREKRGPAVQSCLLRTKLTSIKCKQKCVRRVTVPLQRCSTQLGACLKTCIAR